MIKHPLGEDFSIGGGDEASDKKNSSSSTKRTSSVGSNGNNSNSSSSVLNLDNVTPTLYANFIKETIKKSNLFHFISISVGYSFNCYAHHETVVKLLTLMVNKLMKDYPDLLDESDRTFLLEKPTSEECAMSSLNQLDIKVISYDVMMLIDTKLVKWSNSGSSSNSNLNQQDNDESVKLSIEKENRITITKMDILKLKRDILRVGALVHLYRKWKKGQLNTENWIWSSFEKVLTQAMKTTPQTVLLDGVIVAPKCAMPESKMVFNPEYEEEEESNPILKLAFALDIGFVTCEVDQLSNYNTRWTRGLKPFVEKLENYEW
ncbi:predicted protein [Naegleria gruberi]|uniref:Predicted protein n=1 Tax=Naegleria gruberi TaxID=5762 RepID=D2V670_NAEGR|nr:uncharacterized protein NAEGRDRAFT_64330 [Naegleria gruberi]EFC47913.1 predicted protein [Naegleria gruberi]|eukprot:XP_002680657.1 predicted protein [Naegleria gruberi strain NEG-M]